MYKHILIYWAADYAGQILEDMPDYPNVIGVVSS